MNNKELRLSGTVNFILFIVKLIGGILSKSASFVADSFHSLSICISDSMNIYNYDKERNDKLYYMNVFAGMIILFIGFGVIYNVIGRKYFVPKNYLFVICSITILIKLTLSIYLLYKGKKTDNNLLSLSAYNSRLDVASSMIVLFSAMIICIFKDMKVFRYADMISTFIIGLMIIYMGYNYLKEIISFRIGVRVSDESKISSIKESIIKDKNIKSVDEIILLSVGSYYKLIASVEMDGNYSLIEAHAIRKKIEKKIKREFRDIKDITISVNPYRRVL